MHHLPYRSGWKTIQSQNKCSKVIRIQWLVLLHDLPYQSEWKTIQNQDKCSKVILMQCLFVLHDFTPLKWMENNPKTTQMQQGNPNAMFVFFGMVFLAQMDGKQSKTKTNAAR